MAGRDSDTAIYKEDKTKAKEKSPSMYKILLLNDDFTPMEFVIEVLKIFFYMNQDEATRIMLKVHTEGVGVCGVYTSDIANTKVKQVVAFARKNQHPLRCVMEEN
ncbi:ATP-dependent Clp protease adaptor protein ClpS [Nitrosomonas sp. Nm84]|uniref:ATP-dependent Clp protease adapter ClpS n=1 Tax=Nitrosomonas sp. Nm84 TaxID=200124 RepID=UPI000D75EFEC|nr:ATP-dependent Clp protease adapter ClpS [Nitrosomonas sp. Nm84]PXW86424.1 ATP-dependent Clp protease adaptor protein ClpS [Nitrosomonas sp. Nm84]